MSPSLAQEVAARYDHAEEFPIPDEVDARLRDILEPVRHCHSGGCGEWDKVKGICDPENGCSGTSASAPLPTAASDSATKTALTRENQPPKPHYPVRSCAKRCVPVDQYSIPNLRSEPRRFFWSTASTASSNTRASKITSGEGHTTVVGGSCRRSAIFRAAYSFPRDRCATSPGKPGYEVC